MLFGEIEDQINELPYSIRGSRAVLEHRFYADLEISLPVQGGSSQSKDNDVP